MSWIEGILTQHVFPCRPTGDLVTPILQGLIWSRTMTLGEEGPSTPHCFPKPKQLGVPLLFCRGPCTVFREPWLDLWPNILCSLALRNQLMESKMPSGTVGWLLLQRLPLRQITPGFQAKSLLWVMLLDHSPLQIPSQQVVKVIQKYDLFSVSTPRKRHNKCKWQK